MLSLLANVDRSRLEVEPFPHVVIADPLPEKLSRSLVSEYPSVEWIATGRRVGSNRRFSASASRSLGCVGPLWEEMVRIHTSHAFLSQAMDLFGDAIRRLYPSLERDVGAFGGLRGGVRQRDDFTIADVLLDAQLCINTPVCRSPSAVRRFHCDLPNKLFAGLYYLRHPDDASTGGDLQIGRFKESAVRRFRSAEVDDRHVEVVKTVPYRHNVFVMFANGIDSLHGVTARSTTPWPRYLFNLVGELERPLFDLDEYQEGHWAKLRLRAVTRRLTSWGAF